MNKCSTLFGTTLSSIEGNYPIPDSFGMFSNEGNLAIKSAIVKFAEEASDYAEAHQLTARERLDDFQNESVTGGEEYTH